LNKVNRPKRTIAPRDVDIIVCVHDALEDVRSCLASVVQQTAAYHRLILVDDASNAECRTELEHFAAVHPSVALLRNPQRQGYTRSANRGLRQSDAPFVVLLNSDTIVTPNWLTHLVECANSDPRIGIVGPLSNAATFQSVPQCLDGDGEWSRNPLPPGLTPSDVAAAIARVALRSFPRVGTLNGFCFAIKRAVIDAIGYFDEAAFPDGYGEEQDYGFRAGKAGFALAVADHAYVYHAGTRSYTPDQRRALKQSARAALLRKHGAKRIRAAIKKTYDNPDLRAKREVVGALFNEISPPSVGEPDHLAAVSA
jgi:GT2 family glycosyltransferase